MTLADFQAVVADSCATLSRAAELEAELSAKIARRALADANEKVKLVVNSVKRLPTYGENSDLYHAMGYVTIDD